MDNIEVCENTEALIVLGSTIFGGATTFVGALPIPLEIKAPTVGFLATATGAILIYWKAKVNKAKT